MSNICPWCKRPISVDSFMLRYKEEWHHSSCAHEHAAEDGTTWALSLEQ